MAKMRCFCGLVSALLLASSPLLGQGTVEFDSKRDWEKWTFPVGTVELTDDGLVLPQLIRKNINASLDAGNFVVELEDSTPVRWGGLAGVGSNPGPAANVIDGDPTTGWAPNPQDDMEDWWIEIDLGRVVSATKIVLKFAPDAVPLEMFKVYASNGEEALYSGSGVRDYTLVGQTTRANSAYEVEYSLGLLQAKLSTAEEPRQLVTFVLVQVTAPPGDARLAEVEVHSLGDNVILGTVERGGQAQQFSPGGDRRSLTNNEILDGKYDTYWNSSAGFLDWTEKGWVHIDLGALFWVDTIRIVSAKSHQGSRVDPLFGYKLFVSDGTLGPTVQGVENVMGSFVWEEVGAVDDNSDSFITFEDVFAAQRVQRIFFSHRNNVRDTGTYGQFKTLEIEAYGQGYIPGVTMTSDLQDLSRSKNITTIEWEADIAPGTELAISSRTGDRLTEELHYFDKKGNELTFERWEALPNFRKNTEPTVELVPDPQDFSPWSQPYAQSGARFASPNPRRYVQVQATLLSTAPERALALAKIVLNFGDPLARTLLAEVWPNQVLAAESQEFSYYIMPSFSSGDRGFDRILIKTPSSAELLGVKVGDQLVEASAAAAADSLLIQLDSPVTTSRLVEVQFKTKVFLNGTLFEGSVSNSANPDQWQRLDPGDASAVGDADQLTVFVPVADRLIDKVDIAPIFTPNGDGVNDELAIGFSVLQVDKAQPIIITVHDLTGRAVRQLRELPGLGGDYRILWDGTDAVGDVVPPGLYICRIELETSRDEQVVMRTIAVAF